jgi:hypothetical protein
VNLAHSPEEVELLKLLREVQPILATAIDSLDKDSIPKPEMRFVAWAAVTVNRAADGYLLLRESYRVAASKLLIRPILDAVFAATAVTKTRGFLFRKAFTELLEEKKFHPKNPAAEADFNTILEEIKRLMTKDDPTYPIEKKRVDIFSTAQAAGMQPHYEVIYRTYCQFTHGAIVAASGELDQMTDDLDTSIVVHYVIMMLELLNKNTPAKVPDMAPFLNRLPKP